MKFSYSVSTPHFCRLVLLQLKVGLSVVGVSVNPSAFVQLLLSKGCNRPK